MKKTILIAAGAVLMAGALTACSFSVNTSSESVLTTETETIVETEESAEIVGMANPWTESDMQGVYDATGFNLVVPDDANFAYYSYNEQIGMAQVMYGLDEVDYVVRAQHTDAAEDISGNYYDWAEETTGTVDNCPANFYVNVHDDTTPVVRMVTWYDEATGTSYSLSLNSMTETDLDIQAVAEALFAEM